MKKSLVLLASCFLIIIGCNKSGTNEENLPSDNEMSAPITQRHCASYEVLQEQLKADPTLAERMNKIEEFTKKFIENPSAYKLINGVMEVPVVVNVLYKTAAENIAAAQIQSQIDVLNKDFSGNNSDISRTPSDFTSVLSGDTKIHFTLQSIVRKPTNKKSWSTNDAMKKSSLGGIDPTNPATTLNLWSCNLSNGILGYAQFPGGSQSTDGVVILYSAFGSRASYPAGTYINSYDLGRTATHEIGHYFNLRHIWGDATCGNDQVTDTPPQQTANYGCPGVKNITCTSNATTNPYGFTREITMNYMDYTDDACMYMFTAGQAARMQATYELGGQRATLR